MRRRLRLVREFVALTIAFLGALIISAAMKLEGDTVVDFLRGILEKAEDQ